MYLIRVDPSKNMDRWYMIVVQSTLLDEWAVVCSWGSRRSSYQRHRIYPMPDKIDAESFAEKLRKKKIRRGYRKV